MKNNIKTNVVIVMSNDTITVPKIIMRKRKIIYTLDYNII